MMKLINTGGLPAFFAGPDGAAVCVHPGETITVKARPTDAPEWLHEPGAAAPKAKPKKAKAKK